MTKQNSLKRLIRKRMKETGESYTKARRSILHNREWHSKGVAESTPAARLTVVLAQPATRSGVFRRDLDSLLQAQSHPECDVLLLPELIGGSGDPAEYEAAICGLAKDLGCHVVGGSCYVPTDRALVNSGIVADDQGRVVSRYEKVRPYGSEIGTGIAGGSKVGHFELQGRKFAVLICSDLWFSDTFTGLTDVPDTILIPSFSITQRDDPRKARELWKHMVIARAYEYTSYVGVSDWAHPCKFEGLCAAGVAGFANPRPNGDCFYSTNEDLQLKAYDLDYARLDAFRDNRDVRGFLWKPRGVAGSDL